ncbi:MAG: Hsp20 family protein [Deltaproteobacteria bacterium]|nr:Hsp20 family protein [Deltaproteobacteria bacterium]
MSKPEKGIQKQSRAITPRRQSSEISRWDREMERMFEDFFSSRWNLLRPGSLFSWRERGITMPSVDIDVYDEKDVIVAKAELPGIAKDEISVNVADHSLTIRGEKKKDEEVKEENYRYSERSYGSFMRTIELPAEVQTEKSKARFKDGILEVRLPKTEEAKKKEITVNVE